MHSMYKIGNRKFNFKLPIVSSVSLIESKNLGKPRIFWLFPPKNYIKLKKMDWDVGSRTKRLFWIRQWFFSESIKHLQLKNSSRHTTVTEACTHNHICFRKFGCSHSSGGKGPKITTYEAQLRVMTTTK